MQLSELVALLKTTGYPVAYHHFTESPTIPFIVYLDIGTSNFMADNKVYEKVLNIDVELYTEKKDLSAEKKLEDLFDANEMPWEVEEVWIETEKMYQRIYQIGVK